MKVNLVLGFVGVASGMSPFQRIKFSSLLEKLVAAYDITFVHGDSRGGDEIAHKIAKHLGCRTECFPTDTVGNRAFCECDVVHPTIQFLGRFKKIGEMAERIISVPSKSDENEKSGAWITTRTVLHNKKPVYLILPSGTIWASEEV